MMRQRDAVFAFPLQPLLSMTPRRTILITGASSGIGLELARCFAGGGDALVLTGRDGQALATVAEELRTSHGVKVTPLIAELSSEVGVAQFLQQLHATGLTIDVLVNNAGFGLHGNVIDPASGYEEALTTVHIHAPWLLTRALVPGMVQRGRGGVLNVGSVYSFVPAPWQALYGAAKTWVLSFSLALREELRGTGVNVTVLCPGTTLSRFRTRNGHPPDRASWFTLTAPDVAAAGYRAFNRGKAVVVPGLLYKGYVAAVRLMPRSWLGRFVYLTAYRSRGMATAKLPE